MRRCTLAYALLLVVGLLPTALAQQKVQQLEEAGVERTADGQQVQKKVDGLQADTRNLIDEYQSHLKLVEGLRMYNNMLQKQLEFQRADISILQKSIADVAIVERQILPLMSRMIDGLEQFIALDVPFLLEEREGRTDKLRELLLRADVTVAEKTRRVLEAYQIENDYGRTIEAYKAKLPLGDISFDADFLRIGRVALMYRTVGNEDVGYWDVKGGSWVELDNTPWRRNIEQGLKVARQEIAPELISISINPAQEVKR
jgi:hypothetical protein